MRSRLWWGERHEILYFTGRPGRPSQLSASLMWCVGVGVSDSPARSQDSSVKTEPDPWTTARPALSCSLSFPHTHSAQRGCDSHDIGQERGSTLLSEEKGLFDLLWGIFSLFLSHTSTHTVTWKHIHTRFLVRNQAGMSWQWVSNAHCLLAFSGCVDRPLQWLPRTLGITGHFGAILAAEALPLKPQCSQTTFL